MNARERWSRIGESTFTRSQKHLIFWSFVASGVVELGLLLAGHKISYLTASITLAFFNKPLTRSDLIRMAMTAVQLGLLYFVNRRDRTFSKVAYEFAEAAFFRDSEGRENTNAHLSSVNPFWVALKVYLSFALLGYALSWWVGTGATFVIMYYAGSGLIVMSILWRYQPNSSRLNAYAMLSAGLCISWAAANVRTFEAVGLTASASVHLILERLTKLLLPRVPDFLVAGTTALIVLLIAAGFHSVVGKTWSHQGETKQPTMVLRRIYRGVIITGCLLPFLAFWLMPSDLVFVYLIARYYVVGAIRAYPILYLRSFRYDDAPAAFGRIVCPAATLYGVLIALADKARSSSALQMAAPVTQRIDLYTAEDTQWQKRVTEYLKRCSVVIIDSTIQTSSLDWEIAEAEAILDAGRIVLLRRDEAGTDRTGVKERAGTVSYRLDGHGVRAAKRCLKRSIEHALHGSSSRTKPAWAGGGTVDGIGGKTGAG